MMIVNPNPDLPPPDGAVFSVGAWEREIMYESCRLWKQRHIDGWHVQPVGDRPGLEIDAEHRGSGVRSIRLDPVRSKNYFEQ